ncbi:unnamed protein product [Parnassius mnemosyne]|uniref:RING-type domain-containing protein n=1 Tax=Parnassius mnemosyne TaxID=213953 RepID=A0AAV1M9K4_9NEOP
MSITYIPRVTQLDSVQLDGQVEELFKQLLFNATKFLEPGILQPILPELELLLRTWIFKYSLCDKNCTFGQQMLSLKYNKSNISKSKLYWFIQTGKHPILIDFILGLELTADKLAREDLTDLSWTRELLWHNLIELIGTAVSLINLFGLKRRLSNILKYVWWRKNVHANSNSGSPIMTLNTICAYCSNKPVLPHIMGCSHIFCYYCLMANKAADPDFVCPKCYFNGKNVIKFIMP